MFKGGRMQKVVFGGTILKSLIRIDMLPSGLTNRSGSIIFILLLDKYRIEKSWSEPRIVMWEA